MTTFEGLLITLKKRTYKIPKNDNSEYVYGMFGYYDGMSIKYIDKWYNYRPGYIEDNGGLINIQDNFADKHTLKVYFPEHITSSESCFNYNVWKKDSKDLHTDSAKFPYIIMAQIHLTKECVNFCWNNKKGEENIAEIMVEIIGDYIRIKKHEICSKKPNIGDLDCAIFPSIGYSDLVVLFRADNLSLPSSIIDEMHGLTKDGYQMISDIYSVIGIDNWINKDSLKNIKDENLNVSLAIQLRPGITCSMFYEKWHNWAKAFLVKNNVYKDIGNDLLKVSFYTSCGNNDCTILSTELKIPQYVLLFFSKNARVQPTKMLNPGSDFFQGNIACITSSVNIPLNHSHNSIDSADAHGMESNLVNYQEMFAEFSDKYTQYLKNTINQYVQ